MSHTELQSLVEAVRAESPPQARVHVEPLGEGAIPLQCRHCEDAPCVAVCPTGAVRRVGEDGPVVLETASCIGCRYCLFVCPFGAIDLSRDGKAMLKCDLCFERIERGEDPACVSACPTGALQFRELDDVLRQRRRRAVARLAEEVPAGRDALREAPR